MIRRRRTLASIHLLVLPILWLAGCSSKPSEQPTRLRWQEPSSSRNIVTLPATFTVGLEGSRQAQRVSFLLDGEPIGEATRSPWSLEWNPADPAALGPHRLRAEARDGGGIFASVEMEILAADLNGFYTGAYGGPGADLAHAVKALPGGGFAFVGDLVYPDGDVQGCLCVIDPDRGQRWFHAYGDENEDHLRDLHVTASGEFVLGGWTHIGDDVDGPIFWFIRSDRFGNPFLTRVLGVPPDFEYAHSLTPTGDGGFALAGQGGGASVSSYSLYRTDDIGFRVWNRNYPLGDHGIAYSVLELPDEGFAAVGSVEQGGVNLLRLIRTDYRGALQWSRSFGEGGSYSAGRCLRLADDGGFLMTGGSGGKLWLLKTDAEGEILWSRLHGQGSFDLGLDMIVTSDGGLAAVGFTGGVGGGNRDLWLLKTDAEGQLEGPGSFSLVHGGGAMDEGRALLEMPDGGFVIVGGTDSSGGGLSDMWVLRVDAQGNLRDE